MKKLIVFFICFALSIISSDSIKPQELSINLSNIPRFIPMHPDYKRCKAYEKISETEGIIFCEGNKQQHYANVTGKLVELILKKYPGIGVSLGNSEGSSMTYEICTAIYIEKIKRYRLIVMSYEYDNDIACDIEYQWRYDSEGCMSH